MAKAKVAKNGNIFIDGVVAEYNRTSTPVSKKAQYHAGEYCLATYLMIEDTDELAPLREEAKKVEGCIQLNDEGDGILYNFYSKYPFKVTDQFEDYAPSNRIPNLKEGTKCRICLTPIDNKFRKSGIHYVVVAIKVETLPAYKDAFAEDGEE